MRDDAGCGEGLPKKKKNPKNQPTDFPSSSFFKVPLASAVGWLVDMPPHVGTCSWLWGLPLPASFL
jgi:hypothetical protein